MRKMIGSGPVFPSGHLHPADNHPAVRDRSAPVMGHRPSAMRNFTSSVPGVTAAHGSIGLRLPSCGARRRFAGHS